MTRVTVAALLFAILFSHPARCDEKEDALKEDQKKLVGDWRSASSKSGDSETYRTLMLGKQGTLIIVLRTTVTSSDGNFSLESTDEIMEGLPVVGATKAKGEKRILTFPDVGKEYEVEYELKGDTLELRGSVAGVDISGTWTNAKAKDPKKDK